MPKFKVRHLMFVPYWVYTEVEAGSVDDAIEEWNESEEPGEIDFDNMPEDIDFVYDFDAAEIEINGEFCPIYASEEDEDGIVGNA